MSLRSWKRHGLDDGCFFLGNQDLHENIDNILPYEMPLKEIHNLIIMGDGFEGYRRSLIGAPPRTPSMKCRFKHAVYFKGLPFKFPNPSFTAVWPSKSRT